MATCMDSESSSWKRPLFADIPEGARLVSVLASGQRRGGHRLRFPEEGSDDPELAIDVFLAKESRISDRWLRCDGTGKMAYVPEGAVPASATSAGYPLFACCANTLEVKGGTVRVEGMTLLPPNPPCPPHATPPRPHDCY